jgi:hypothetical protein
MGWKVLNLNSILVEDYRLNVTLGNAVKMVLNLGMGTMAISATMKRVMVNIITHS